MGEQTYSEILQGVIDGNDLTREQGYWVFTQIMDGAWSEPQIAGILIAFSSKGETVEEIAGAGQAMRDHSVRIDSGGADVLDTCGTGGTGLPTLNVSTAAALVAAGAGVKVAKHGNRTHTRPSGSADVLVALGVNIEASPETVTQCLNEANVCFCYAVKHHPAMKYAAPVRKALGVRTIFNILGPLTNPAGAKRQLMGIFDGNRTEQIANVLSALGAVRAMVVHAADGLDELSTTAETKISELSDGKVETRTVKPEDFNIPRAKMDDLLIESSKQSAEIIRDVLSGQTGPARDIVVLNSAAALVVADRARTIPEAIPIAQQAIDSGSATNALEKLITISNS